MRFLVFFVRVVLYLQWLFLVFAVLIGRLPGVLIPMLAFALLCGRTAVAFFRKFSWEPRAGLLVGFGFSLLALTALLPELPFDHGHYLLERIDALVSMPRSAEQWEELAWSAAAMVFVAIIPSLVVWRASGYYRQPAEATGLDGA